MSEMNVVTSVNPFLLDSNWPMCTFWEKGQATEHMVVTDMMHDAGDGVSCFFSIPWKLN